MGTALKRYQFGENYAMHSICYVLKNVLHLRDFVTKIRITKQTLKLLLQEGIIFKLLILNNYSSKIGLYVSGATYVVTGFCNSATIMREREFCLKSLSVNRIP